VKTTVILGAVLIIFLVDIFAPVRIAGSEVTSRMQKVAWLLFIWVAPLLGALLALQVSKEANVAAPVAGSFESGPDPSLGLITGAGIGTDRGTGGCGGGQGGGCGSGDS